METQPWPNPTSPVLKVESARDALTRQKDTILSDKKLSAQVKKAKIDALFQQTALELGENLLIASGEKKYVP